MKLVSMILSSLLLALGGAGAASAVNSYVRAHVETTTLANLDDVTPLVTPTETPTPTPLPTETSTVSPAPTPTHSLKPSVSLGARGNEDDGISAGAETEIGEE